MGQGPPWAGPVFSTEDRASMGPSGLLGEVWEPAELEPGAPCKNPPLSRPRFS